MRTLLLLPLVTVSLCSFAGGESNIIARSDWSKPVSTRYSQTLRGRMLIAQEHSPAHAGPWPETELYLELQNVSGAVGPPMRIYFDPGRGLRCELLNSLGKSLPERGTPGSGGGAGACWIILPYDSTIRLRANAYGYGMKPGDGFSLRLSPPGSQDWAIRAGDTNTYFLSSSFTVTPPTNHITQDFDEARTIWNGTLELPKMKIEIPKP